MKTFIKKLALGEYLSGWKTLSGTILMTAPYLSSVLGINLSAEFLDAFYSLGVETAGILLAAYGLWGKAVSIFKGLKK